MRIEVHIHGPGIDERRHLAEGDGEIVLGRDGDCHVCLPDPRRNVSRRHLAVWCEAGELHFRVLSVVNGVELPFGEAPPGARGVLPHGQMLRLGDYRLLGASLSPAEEDPWTVLERDASGFGESGLPPQGGRAAAALAGPAPMPTDDDPFGDWGFDSTFGPGSRAGTLSATPESAGSAELAAFYRGLGLDPARLGPMGAGELEEMGQLVRMALLGLLALHAGKAELKRTLRAEDRTMVAREDNNPLKSGMSDEMSLQYLFGGRDASVGFVRPERALADLLAELHIHDAAMAVAARAVVEGTLRDLSPASLKASLGGGKRLFEASRLWDAYAKLHEEQGADLSPWLERLMGKYFTAAYLRESQRLKREPFTRPGAAGPHSGS